MCLGQDKAQQRCEKKTQCQDWGFMTNYRQYHAVRYQLDVDLDYLYQTPAS